jgi:uncharacterized membrane protein YqjE
MPQAHIPSSVESDRLREERLSGDGTGRSVMDLLGELREESLALMRQEMELARVEMMEKASRMLRNVMYLGAGAAIAGMGLLFLLASLTAGLIVAMAEGGVDRQMAPWLAPLLVGFVLLGLGAAFVMKAVATLRRSHLEPRQTIDSLKENKRWLTAKLRPITGA